MALATVSDLQASIATWLRRYDLGGQIPDFITLAEANMNRILRTSRQLASAPITIANQFEPLPAEMRMMRTLRLTSGTGRMLNPATVEQMQKLMAVNTTLYMEPRSYVRGGDQLQFWPVPDQAYTALMEYQLQIPPLNQANPTNWILTDHPDVYLFGALAAAYAFLKNDQRAGDMQGQFVRAMGELQASLRTNFDRVLRVDPGLQSRFPRAFNWISGDTI